MVSHKNASPRIATIKANKSPLDFSSRAKSARIVIVCNSACITDQKKKYNVFIDR